MKELWKEIDLSKHGVIEAHAGTGKTHTIVNLALAILETPVALPQGGCKLTHIREIMLVTFTEKAAGELRKRIREGLESRIRKFSSDTPIGKHLESCLNNMHEALIGTIHAVCLRLLRTWPFESGVSFTAELVDDSEGLEACLRDSMRTDWQQEETAIAALVQILADHGVCFNKQHAELAVKTAQALLDFPHTELVRPVEPPADPLALRDTLLLLRRRKQECLSDVRGLAGKLIRALKDADDEGLIGENKKEQLQQRLAELEKIHAGFNINIGVLVNPVKVGSTSLFTLKNLKTAPGLSHAAALCDEISSHPFIEAATELDAQLRRALLSLVCEASKKLAVRWSAVKRTEGLLSYRDMLGRMHEAIVNNPAFAASLRSRIAYAIIDEFQDTSRTQWEIFKTLFLSKDAPGGTRLFIVGDPKQSIYMFQGADVDSYLAACKAVEEQGGKLYTLSYNFRSIDATVRGYNAIFLADVDGKDWFHPRDYRRDGISYRSSEAVMPAVRTSAPLHPLTTPPIQIFILGGSAGARRKSLIENIGRAILQWYGTTISVPDGVRMRDITLRYEHFAVIVETHALAEPVLAHLRSIGIPAIKYKMEGVFQSPIVRSLAALIGAILSPPDAPAARLAALLTHFFNRKPSAVDPESDLAPCANPLCDGDSLCMFHALQEWTGLADRRLWAQLFHSIESRTRIRQRLIRLQDGERHCADLRQAIDYCMEKLYRENYTLSRLHEHLCNLIDREISPGQDRNLHVLETQKSSVKVLTMHAAKGLEFPVVFVVTGGSRTKLPKGPDILRWTRPDQSGDGRSVCITPYLSVKDIEVSVNGTAPSTVYLDKAKEERRRLLYVALTRAQALLFLPAHFNAVPDHTDKGFRWSECRMPSHSPDEDLTPALQHVLDARKDNPEIGIYAAASPAQQQPDSSIGRDAGGGSAGGIPATCPDIRSLALRSRICLQTSYSRISREIPMARDIDKSEETDLAFQDDSCVGPSALPAGKDTGDALHCVIEEILCMEDCGSVAADNDIVRRIVEKHLERNGVLSHAAEGAGDPDTAVSNAVTSAVNCVRGALTSSMELPGGGAVNAIVSLRGADRIPEMEFLLFLDCHWVHGFMDLVFRVRTGTNTGHPWRYFVLDWKSDRLAYYDHQTIASCIEERHYSIQARLYCHALDRYLGGVLGEKYDPATHLGGAIYFFLREHEIAPLQKATVWIRAASPAEDAAYSADLVKAGRL